ncbi:MAG: hypothetical protein GF398_21195 [Chitinivibrionales bacterium]|nr:hypothetical protein [Chitinivibrionales bacterium]
MSLTAWSLEPTGIRDKYAIYFNASYNARRGHLDIRNMRQDTAQEPLFLWGGGLARRYYLNRWSRLQFAFFFNVGGVDVDTLENAQIIESGAVSFHDLYYRQSYTHFALEPELHVFLPSRRKALLYLRAGAGFNFMKMEEKGLIDLEDELFRSPVEVPDNMSGQSYSINPQIGVGVEFAVGERSKLTLSYLNKYMFPLAYKFSRSMPLGGVDYWESFRVHMLQIGLAWAGE